MASVVEPHRIAWRGAFWMSVPAIALSTIAFACLILFFPIGHAMPYYQYNTPETMPWSRVWALCWLLLTLGLPLAGLLLVCSVFVHVRAGGWAPLLAMRVLGLIACRTAWIVTVANMPDA
jgi:hypothetical protein